MNTADFVAVALNGTETDNVMFYSSEAHGDLERTLVQLPGRDRPKPVFLDKLGFPESESARIYGLCPGLASSKRQMRFDRQGQVVL